MKTSASLPEKERTKSFLFICGILSSSLYIAMNIFILLLWPGYSSASQTVSELSAIGAPTRTLWLWLGFVYTLLMIAFSWAVWKSRPQNRWMNVAGGFLFAYAAISLIWPLAPMHQREVLAAGGKTLTDTMHLVLATVTVVLMLLAMGFGAAAFGKRFRYYTILTMFVLLLFGLLTAADAPKVEANHLTPFAGILERINIGVFLLWVVVLAVNLLKGSQASSVKS